MVRSPCWCRASGARTRGGARRGVNTPAPPRRPHHGLAESRTHLFDLEVVGAQRLLYLLLGAARRRLHGAAEPVQHPLERELLHVVSRGVRCARRRLHHSRPPRPASRFWPRKLAPAPLLRRAPARRRRRPELGEAAPECTPMRSAADRYATRHRRTALTAPTDTPSRGRLRGSAHGARARERDERI